MDFRETVTLSSLILRNVAGTYLNTFTNTTTAARTWTFPDKTGTIALASVGVIDAFAGAIPSDYLLCDGTAKSRTTYANLFSYLITNQGFNPITFTVTIATPAVFTKTAHGFTGGERVRLSTTGALPTGLVTTIDYYVIYVTANTYQLSTTFGGTAVATTGTQSGTHSYTQSLYGTGDGSTTFNVPDLRAQTLRGLDAGAGIDTARSLGTNQSDMFGSHTHSPVSGVLVVSGGSTAAIPNTGAYYQSGTLANAGGVETRGKNVAVNYGIRY
jgi:microcystin-dependent protein